MSPARSMRCWLLALGLTFAAAAQAQPTVSTPAATCSWCDIAVTWSGIVSPTSTNMLALTAPGSMTHLNYRFTNGASSGTLPLNVPGSVPFGNYVIRLYHPGHPTLVATSAQFQVLPTVSGTVTSGGSPLAGVGIAGTNGAQCNAITDASGHWGCLIPYGWSGTVTVSKPGNLFTPASRSYTNVTDHINSNNFATAASHALSGTITREGLALSGVAVVGSNGASCTATNASGQYTCAVLPGWSGTVTPSLPDTVFTPASRSYTSVSAAQPAQDYIAQAAFYQVSGSVTLNGLALANVALAATGGPTCTSSNGAGQYSCTVPLGWSGSVTPSASGYSFGPASRSYTSDSSHQGAQTFTASLDTATAPLYFVQVDHLNTPRLVANQSGQTVWRWDQQEPFGVNVPDENPSSLGAFEFPLRFPGQYADKETNLHYNYFRDYDSVTGRYVQSDPIGLKGGLNTYAYADHNALQYIDIRGLATTCVTGMTPAEAKYQQCFWQEIQTCLYGAPAICGLGALGAMSRGILSPKAIGIGFAVCVGAVAGGCILQKHYICTARAGDPDGSSNDPWDPGTYPWQRSIWYR
jgi:RHS repeat-associated protein